MDLVVSTVRCTADLLIDIAKGSLGVGVWKSRDRVNSGDSHKVSLGHLLLKSLRGGDSP
jgi:hypothetical protein